MGHNLTSSIACAGGDKQYTFNKPYKEQGDPKL